MTTRHDPAALRRATRELQLLLLAAGLDPSRVTLFRQSHVPSHTELAYLLECTAHLGELGRMVQFKQKRRSGDGAVSATRASLLTYPVLMAADILLYNTDVVPVGEDQKQHVELTRDVAIRFNHRFGETFVLPEPLIGEAGARIMSLSDPTSKMSKSDEDPNGTIALLDPPDLVRRKIMRAQTDSGREARFDESRPGITNLLEIYHVLAGGTRESVEEHFAGRGYGEVKRELGELVVAALEPLQRNYRRYTDDPAELNGVLQRGRDRAASLAERTLHDVQEKVGLR
jgi:tryptophanyl-tRNA synthetase